MDRVEEINRSRYAQMQSTIMNRSSLSNLATSGKSSLLGKFATMEEDMRSIQEEARRLLCCTEESSRVVQQMKRGLGEKQMGQCREKCMEQIRKFDKVVEYSMAETGARTASLWEKCRKLQNGTEQLRGQVTAVNARLNALENVLGYYSGAQIVSQY